MNRSLQYVKGMRIWELGSIMFFLALTFLPFIHVFFIVIDIMYIAYAFITSSSDKAYRRTFLSFLAIIAFIAFLYTVLNDSTSVSSDVSNYAIKRFASKFSQYLTMFFPLCLLRRVLVHASIKQQNIIFLTVLASMLYMCYSTLTGLQSDVMASRDNSFAEDKDYLLVGYSEVYAYSFLSLLFYLLALVHKKGRAFYLLAFLFFFYFLYKVMFALALVIVTIAMAYTSIVFMKTRVSKILVTLSIVIFVSILPAILDSILPMINAELAKTKANEISGFLRLEYDQDSDLWIRLQLYWKSIKAFFASPFWGNRWLPFDGHATLLMCFADLGIIGGIPIWFLFLRSNKIVKKHMSGYEPYFAPFFFMIILDGLTNPIHSQTSLFMLLWFIIPMFLTRVLSSNKLLVP